MKRDAQPTPEFAEELGIEELFLLHLRYKESKLVETGGNTPILLQDDAVSWVVYRGWVDIFAVPMHDGRVSGSRTHLFRCNTGEGLFGLQQQLPTNQIALLAVGSKKASLLQIPTHRLQTLGQDEEFGPQIARMLDHWVKHFLNYLSPYLPPKDCLRLNKGETKLAKNRSVCARQGLLWVKHQVGHSYFAGNAASPSLNGRSHWPISERGWILTSESSVLQLVDTPALLNQQPSWPDLHYFLSHVLLEIENRLQLDKVQDAQRVQAKIDSDREVVQQAFNHLLQPLLFRKRVDLDDDLAAEPLLRVCHLVGKAQQIDIKMPTAVEPGQTQSLTAVARASHVQIRQVALKGEWWQQNAGPLVAFMGEENSPVALLFRKGHYWLYQDETDGGRKVTAVVADRINPFAYMFYRSLPFKALTAWDLLLFAIKPQRGNLWTLAKMGIAVGLLSMLVPMATGFLFDQVIPNSHQTLLLQIAVYLVGAVLAMTLFQLMQGLAMLKLQGQLGLDIQSAVWARTLNLPVSFFRDYSAGDLGARIMGISALQQLLTGTVMGAILSGIFSLFSFFLLFYYDSTLAWVATLLVGITAVVVFVTGRLQVRHQRVVADLQGRLTGSVLQAIEGISKFRAAGAEGHAFAVWAKDFSQLKSVNFKARSTAVSQQLFHAGFQVITVMVIFAVIAFGNPNDLSTGQILAFYAAFSQFLGSVLALSMALVSVFNAVPMYERAKPILQALPEFDILKRHPGKLVGDIEIANVTFRYNEETPDVVKGVSVEIKSGEFVAIVGPSGSGKSTLLRMLLGFELPQKGTIYFDGQDIKQLDLPELRRQIGVVLQNGQIMAGDIFTNIKGASNLTLNDAWHAAKLAGLDKDIKMMPMGMHTVLSHGGSTLSGGQRQRLLIARAIINRPRILFFDEATSALDNRTQAIVSESLDNLQATRIVIAHRLSTIKNADKIIVMQNGQVVQQGSYEELIKSEGLFVDLAKRQMV